MQTLGAGLGWAGLGWAGLGWAGRGNVHYEGGGEYPEYQNYDDQLLIFISDEVASRGGWVGVGVFCLYYRTIAIFRHYRKMAGGQVETVGSC